MQEKLAVTFLVITLALFGLVLVLYNMIKETNEEYTQVVLNQHSTYDSRTIAYRRGDIVDRNGTYLATSEQVYNLIIDANQINSARDSYLEPTLSLLTEVFGFERDHILEKIDGNPASYYIVYKTEADAASGEETLISIEKKKEFEQKAEEINKEFKSQKSKKRVKGAWFEGKYRRIYPYNSLACNVIGFSYDNGKAGNGGIEQYYNEELIGNNGRQYGYLDSESNMEKVIKPAENGNTIVSTIDANIQKIIEKYMDEWMDGIGSETIAALVMNPNNGEILAMGTNRRYDLNDPRNLSGVYTARELAAMTQDEQTEAWNKLWRNYCVSDAFEPGSPSKAFTVAAALEEGVIGQQETFVCDGGQKIGKWDIRCVNRQGHGSLSAEQAIMKSCNDCMMQMASRLGIERFANYLAAFGMGSKTGIDLPGEADTSGLVYTAENMGPADMACNSFGQTYNCTMVQMAAGIASVINGGSYYEPHVVKQILDDQGAIVKKVEPKLVREVISQSTSDFVTEAMHKTVEDEAGTGKAGRVSGYQVGGKTGTAQKLPRSANNYLVSFIGFAPADDPQVLTYVVIDTPNLPGKEQAHSTFATEVFQKIMKDLLPYMNIFPEDDVVTMVDESLSDQGEGISNNNQGGLEPGGQTEHSEENESASNEETTGESVESTENEPDEEYIPYDDGLGLPDSAPGMGTVPLSSEAANVTDPDPAEPAAGNGGASGSGP